MMNVNNFSKITLLKANNLKELSGGYLENYISMSCKLDLEPEPRWILTSSIGQIFVTDFLGEEVNFFYIGFGFEKSFS